MAYRTGQRIVGMVEEDLRPSDIMTRAAFENAIVACSAIGGSTNCPPHLVAIARHMGVALTTKDWETVGYEIPLLANVQPAGEYLTESFHLAGGMPAILGELLRAGKLHGGARNVSGKTMAECYAGMGPKDERVIRRYENPLKENAGFLVFTGNIFSTALVKASVIGEEFRSRFLSEPGRENVFTARAVVFEGPEDYHARINDEALGIDERSILVIRNCGPKGYPGAAEVVNMLPPDKLVQMGVNVLPTMGDGRQSGTSASASILHVSPEAASGGRLALLETGDQIEVDFNTRQVMAQVSEEEWERRRAKHLPFPTPNATPWQELYRAHVGELEMGGVLEFAVKYRNVSEDVPRHNH